MSNVKPAAVHGFHTAMIESHVNKLELAINMT